MDLYQDYLMTREASQGCNGSKHRKKDFKKVIKKRVEIYNSKKYLVLAYLKSHTYYKASIQLPDRFIAIAGILITYAFIAKDVFEIKYDKNAQITSFILATIIFLFILLISSVITLFLTRKNPEDFSRFS